MNAKFLLSILVLPVVNTQAQNVSPFWSLSGNSNSSVTSKFGTTNAVPIKLITNNVPRIFIAANGRVGVGTTTPISQFHVEGPTLLSYFVSTDVLGAQSGSGVIGYTKFLPTAAGQRLGYFLTGSQGGGADPGNGTGMAGYAEGAWSSTSRPAYLTFETTKTGNRLRSEAMRISSNGYVGIGTSSPAYRLHVADSSIAIYAQGQGASSYGVYATAGAYGVFARGDIGVRGESSYIFGEAVFGYASGSAGYGGLFTSSSSYGVLATTYTASSFAGYFQGNVYTTGTYTGSDKKLKKNISEFDDAVSIIKKLKPRSYEFQTEGKMAEMNLPKGKHYGLIAQDLEKILPELVKETEQFPRRDPTSAAQSGAVSSTNPQTFKAVNYTELIPILVKGIQEQDEQLQKQELKLQKMDSLEAKLQTLQLAIQEIKASLSSNTISSPSSASLEAPVPNPAKGSTNIHYRIPAGSASARLTVANMLGQVMREIKVSTGSGQVNLNVSNLAAGTYPCTLWVNGQQAVSKQLIVSP